MKIESARTLSFFFAKNTISIMRTINYNLKGGIIMLFGILAGMLYVMAVKGFELFGYIMVICNVISFIKRAWLEYEEEMLEKA